MKYKKNNNKFKFPVDIKGDLDVPDFDISDNFSTEITKNKKKKCQSNNLM